MRRSPALLALALTALLALPASAGGGDPRRAHRHHGGARTVRVDERAHDLGDRRAQPPRRRRARDGCEHRSPGDPVRRQRRAQLPAGVAVRPAGRQRRRNARDRRLDRRQRHGPVPRRKLPDVARRLQRDAPSAQPAARRLDADRQRRLDSGDPCRLGLVRQRRDRRTRNTRDRDVRHQRRAVSRRAESRAVRRRCQRRGRRDGHDGARRRSCRRCRLDRRDGAWRDVARAHIGHAAGGRRPGRGRDATARPSTGRRRQRRARARGRRVHGSAAPRSPATASRSRFLLLPPDARARTPAPPGPTPGRSLCTTRRPRRARRIRSAHAPRSVPTSRLQAAAARSGARRARS